MKQEVFEASTRINYIQIILYFVYSNSKVVVNALDLLRGVVHINVFLFKVHEQVCFAQN